MTIAIEPQGSAEDPHDNYPTVGWTGVGDMRTTEPHGKVRMLDGRALVLIDEETYQIMLRGIAELYDARIKLRGRIRGIAPGDDGEAV